MVMPLLVATGRNLPLLAGRWQQRRLLPLPFYVATALTAFTVVSLFSRAGFLALGAVVIMFVVVQRRRITATAALGVLALLAFWFVPLPKGYLDRIETIQTYEEIEETSALSRLHFWRVAVDMAVDRPLGVGLGNFEALYDRYDRSGGKFGSRRAVHSSHLEVLAETGFGGEAVYAALFGYALFTGFRIRKRSRRPGLSPSLSRFYFTTANALILSMVAFLVGGAFISLALNDLTWLTFALVSSLDRLSRKQLEDAGTQADQAPAANGQASTSAGDGRLPESRQAAARSFVWD